MATTSEVYQMLGKGAVWEAVHRSREALLDLPHAIVGGLAVCLHGYQRTTIDVDILIRREDTSKVKTRLINAGFTWDSNKREFRTIDGVPVHFLLSNDPAGDDRSLGVKLPELEAEKTVVMIEEIPVLTLARLIEMKLACGQGNARRMHRDFADVVELIIVHSLRRSFAQFPHKNVRKAFRELVLRARGEGARGEGRGASDR